MEKICHKILLVTLLFFSSCRTISKQFSTISPAELKIDTTLLKQQEMENFLAPFHMRMDSLMDVVVGISNVPLSKSQPESTMGNFMADAQLFIAQKINPKVSVSVINYGGMRIPYVSPGKITKGKIYEMMPFDNKLTIVEIPGSILIEFCHKMAASKGWPVAGLQFQIQNGKAVDIFVNGQKINPQLIYLTAVSDYIANGGDHCEFLIPCKREYKNVFVRDMLIEYLEDLTVRGEYLNSKIENRIRYAD